MGYRYPPVLDSVFAYDFLFSLLFISSRQMLALTQRGKHLLLVDLEDEEDGLGNIDAIGMFDQWAVRCEAAQEQAAARAQEPADNQVCTFIYVVSCIHYDMFVKIQDDDTQPPTPLRSSPVRQEGRNMNLSPATQRRNSLPAAQRGRSHSSSLNLTPSPHPNQLQRTPPQSNACPAMSSPTCVPLIALGRSNTPRAQGNAQRCQPIQPLNVIASSS